MYRHKSPHSLILNLYIIYKIGVHHDYSTHYVCTSYVLRDIAIAYVQSVCLQKMIDIALREHIFGVKMHYDRVNLCIY